MCMPVMLIAGRPYSLTKSNPIFAIYTAVAIATWRRSSRFTGGKKDYCLLCDWDRSSSIRAFEVNGYPVSLGPVSSPFIGVELIT